tara:strand:- start:429 stop:599 length:171 start_codon:yes stop_codon:yes gene_type:complete
LRSQEDFVNKDGKIMIKLEYIWLGGNQPQELRSKTRVVSDFTGTVPELEIDYSYEG